MLERAPAPPAIISLHYALGKEYEDLGDYDAAFHHFSCGATVRRQTLSYSRSPMHVAKLRRIIESFACRTPPCAGARADPSRLWLHRRVAALWHDDASSQHRYPRGSPRARRRRSPESGRSAGRRRRRRPGPMSSSASPGRMARACWQAMRDARARPLQVTSSSKSCRSTISMPVRSGSPCLAPGPCSSIARPRIICSPCIRRFSEVRTRSAIRSVILQPIISPTASSSLARKGARSAIAGGRL